MTDGQVPPGDPTPPLELLLAQQANAAIKAGKDPAAVTEHLHQVIGHLRSNPDFAAQGQAALDAGKDPDAVGSYISQQYMAQRPGSGSSRSFGRETPTPSETGPMEYMAGSVPFVNKATALSNAAIDKVRGGSQPFWHDYDQRLESLQGGMQQFEKAHPASLTHPSTWEAPALAVAGNAIPAALTLGGSTEAQGAGALMRIIHGADVGMKMGAVQGLSQAHSSGTAPKLSDYVSEVGKNAALGGVSGGVLSGVGQVGVGLARKAGLPDAVSNLAQGLAERAQNSGLRRYLTTAADALGTRGKAAAKLAPRVQEDADAGFVPQDAPQGVSLLPIDKAGPSVRGQAEGIVSNTGPGRGIISSAVEQRGQQMRPDLEKAYDQSTGTTPQSGEDLIRRLADEKSNIANVSRINDESQFPKAPMDSPLAAWADLNGGNLQNGVAAHEALVAKKNAVARQMFGAAREATRGQPVQSETFDAIRQTPAGQLAYEWALAQKANRQSPLASITETPEAPPGIKPEDWQNSLRLSAERKAAANGAPRATNEPPALPIRDEAGRLRRDLSSVSTDDLEKEWRRLAELNAEEEAQHGAVEDAGYRGAYEELPRTEKLGHVGKEDLPDADGAVDPEALLRDNKTVSGYNKNQIVRGAREKSMARINAELSGRPIADPNDFSFGANVKSTAEAAPPAGPSLPGTTKELPDPETLHYMKQRLAKIARLGVHDGQGGTLATQAQGALGLFNQVRNELPPIWRQADDATAEQFRLIDANNMGRDLMRTQLNPSGNKALHTSMDAVERRFAEMTPEQQQAARVGMQSAITDHLRSGNVSAKGLSAQLQEPSSAMARRIALAIGDNTAPQRLAQSLGLHYQGPVAPTVPAPSSEGKAAGLGLDVFAHRTSAPSNAPNRSLAVLDQSKAAMAPTERQQLQQGAAQAVRGKMQRTPNTSLPKLFSKTPELARQVQEAFPSPQAANEFGNRAAFWDRAQSLKDQLTGNSRTAVRGAEAAASAEGAASQSAVKQVLTGHPRQALGTLINQQETAAQRAQREKIDAIVARMLTNPSRSLSESVEADRFRRSLGAGASHLLPAIGGGATTTDR